jgi:hypothetical protein
MQTRDTCLTFAATRISRVVSVEILVDLDSCQPPNFLHRSRIHSTKPETKKRLCLESPCRKCWMSFCRHSNSMQPIEKGKHKFHGEDNTGSLDEFFCAVAEVSVQVKTQNRLGSSSTRVIVCICAQLNPQSHPKICDENFDAIYVISLGELEYEMMSIAAIVAVFYPHYVHIAS